MPSLLFFISWLCWFTKRLKRKMIVLDRMQQQWRWKPDSLVSLLLASQYVVYFTEVVFLGISLQCQYEYPERLTRCRGGSGWMWKDHAVVRSSWRDREVVRESICQGVFNFFLTFRDSFILVTIDFVLKKNKMGKFWKEGLIMSRENIFTYSEKNLWTIDRLLSYIMRNKKQQQNKVELTWIA